MLLKPVLFPATNAPSCLLSLLPPSFCRTAVSQAPWQVEAERKKQEALQAILNAPKPEHPEQTDAPAKMDEDQDDGLPEVTAQNSGTILKKLKAKRLAAAKGVVPGKKKKANPLGGANQVSIFIVLYSSLFSRRFEFEVVSYIFL